MYLFDSCAIIIHEIQENLRESKISPPPQALPNYLTRSKLRQKQLKFCNKLLEEFHNFLYYICFDLSYIYYIYMLHTHINTERGRKRPWFIMLLHLFIKDLATFLLSDLINHAHSLIYRNDPVSNAYLFLILAWEDTRTWGINNYSYCPTCVLSSHSVCPLPTALWSLWSS